eukprot:7760429-Pyramimonas_sp.AAC.1
MHSVRSARAPRGSEDTMPAARPPARKGRRQSSKEQLDRQKRSEVHVYPLELAAYVDYVIL